MFGILSVGTNAIKLPARYTTTGAITLSGLGSQATGDWVGSSLTAADRILVKNQADAKTNGIYAAAAGAWTRTTDFDNSVEVIAGTIVVVAEGVTLADTLWELATNNPITIGTSLLNFVQFGGASSITGTLTPNSIVLATGVNTIGDSLLTQSGSDIGLSTAVPTSKFHITGSGTTFATYSLKVESSTNVALLHVRDDGWIGAGDNVNRNLVIGLETGFPTPDGLNLRNTFIGTKAAATFATGSDNTIVGSIGMWQANGCDSNTGVGTEVLYSITTGSFNTILGKQSGFSLTTGNNNTFLGYEAGIALTTQSNCTAVGSLALDENTAGSCDAFGAEALGENTTGTGNIGLGQNTLGLNVTGINNTAVGINAGFNCKGNGTSNVYVGFQAGYNNFSGANGGNRNVFVGESAGQENTGSDNVFIGYRCAQSSAYDASSGILLVHNDTTNNPLIHGNFTNRNLALNTTVVSSWGTDSVGVLAIGNGTAPSTDIANQFAMYSLDIVAGNAAPHFRTETGDVVKLFKGAALTTTLTSVSSDAPVTPDYAIQALVQGPLGTGPYGFVTSDEAQTVISVIANLQARVNDLEARLQGNGLIL
ncbi:MAG: hypothetical protein A2Z57_04010 [Planctomycetes bacterium RIFCSPHIGHO2_12_39_6]|nr:MAG: hypothetical protein A2Z57_04010 [Planctomycetes bacterium RIFCSPHIGHO2_12_39_6]